MARKPSQKEREKQAKLEQFQRQQAIQAETAPAPEQPTGSPEELTDRLYEMGAVVGGGKVAVRGPDGTAGTVDVATLPQFLKANPKWGLESLGAYHERLAKEKYESTGAQFQALGEGALRGASFGVSDILAEDIGNIADVDLATGMEERQTRNPVSATAGEIAGIVTTALIPGAPANLAARAGGAVSAIGRGGGLAARLATGAAGAAVEGALISAPLSATEAARRGEDAEGIASAALKGGLMGGAFSGGVTLGLGIVGEPLRRMAQRQLVEPIVAETVAPAVRAELEATRDIIASRARVAKGVGKADDLVMNLQKEVDGLRARLAPPEAVADAEAELFRTREALRTDQNLLRNATARAKQEHADLLAKSAQDSAVGPERAADTVLAVRSAWDPVWSQAKLLADRVGFGEVETVQAYRNFIRAQNKFDDFFVAGIEKGKHTATKIETHDAATMAKAIRANPGTAAKLVGEYERTGQALVGRLEAEGMLVPPDPLRPLGMERNPNTGATYSPRSSPLEVYTGGKEAFTQAASDLRPRMTTTPGEIEAGLRASGEQSLGRNLAKKADLDALIADMRKDRGRFKATEGELERAKAKAADTRGRLRELDELAARRSELEPVVADLEKVAKGAGIHITPADVAAVAIELGLDDNSELKWLARAHLLMRRFKGGNGVFDLLGSKIGGKLARAGMRTIIPGQGLVREMVIDAASSAERGIYRRSAATFQPKLVKASLSPQSVRAEFNSRVSAAMKKLGRITEAPKSLAVKTAAVLSSIRFAPMKHEGDGHLPENQKLFERRMKELEQATGDVGTTRESIRGRVSARTALDDVDADAVTEAMARTLEFLRSKAPPARPSGPWDTGRNASDLEIDDWAQYLRYTMDPPAVMEDLADGTLTSQGPEVLREAYPAWYASMQQELVARIAVLRDALPYEQRVLIGNSFDLRLDGSDDPQVAIVLQRVSQRPSQPEPPPQRAPVKNKEEPTKGQSLG